MTQPIIPTPPYLPPNPPIPQIFPPPPDLSLQPPSYPAPNPPEPQEPSSLQYPPLYPPSYPAPNPPEPQEPSFLQGPPLYSPSYQPSNPSEPQEPSFLQSPPLYPPSYQPSNPSEPQEPSFLQGPPLYSPSYQPSNPPEPKEPSFLQNPPLYQPSNPTKPQISSLPLAPSPIAFFTKISFYAKHLPDIAPTQKIISFKTHKNLEATVQLHEESNKFFLTITIESSKFTVSFDKISKKLLDDVTSETLALLEDAVFAIKQFELTEKWQQNATNKNQQGNQEILYNLIIDTTISNKQLYLFMTGVKIRSNGRWFARTDKTKTPLADVFIAVRGNTVAEFYKEHIQMVSLLDRQEALRQLEIFYADFSKKEHSEKQKLVLKIFQNSTFSDDVLEYFFIEKNIPFSEIPCSRFLRAALFRKLRERNISIHKLPPPDMEQSLAKWKENARIAASESADALQAENENYLLLQTFILSSISDQELYQFLKATGVSVKGAWFFGLDGQPTDLSLILTKQRGLPVTEFFKKGFLTDKSIEWTKNPNIQILSNVATHSLISREDFLTFCEKLTPKPDKSASDPIIQRYFGDSTQLIQFDPLLPAIPVMDPLQHTLSINSHGSYSSSTFILPNDVYILVPDPKGFDSPYTLESPPAGQSFEEMMYAGGKTTKQFLTPSSGGWKLYRPGETVNNLHLSPWTPSGSTQEEYDSWKERAPVDAAAVAQQYGVQIPRFAKVPARSSIGDVLLHEKSAKEKFKIFGATDLQSIIETLLATKSPRPIILIPFACNYNPAKQNASISIKSDPPTDLKVM